MVALVSVACTPVPAPYRLIEVARVIDGDTVVAATGERVRLLGVDAPELGGDQGPAECGAREAAEELTRLAVGRTAAVISDPDAGQVDRYGRTLAYLELDGVDVGKQLVTYGWATVWVPARSTRPARVNVYELHGWRARTAGHGLWAECATVGRGNP